MRIVTPQSFWSYKATPALDYAVLPIGTFNGTREQWEALSPGMRREIVRQKLKLIVDDKD